MRGRVPYCQRMTNLHSKLAILSAVVLLSAGTAVAQKPAAKGSPFDTKAVVEVKSDDKVIPLKREEQIAFMFVNAIHTLQGNCGMGSAEPCTLAALIRGPKKKDDFGVGKLKFDPNATDPNYTYKVALKGADWEIWATPKKPGLGSFYAKGKFFGGTFYKAAGGIASESDLKLDGTSVSGDLFYELFQS
jgi:hypothetical protein